MFIAAGTYIYHSAFKSVLHALHKLCFPSQKHTFYWISGLLNKAFPTV